MVLGFGLNQLKLSPLDDTVELIPQEDQAARARTSGFAFEFAFVSFLR